MRGLNSAEMCLLAELALPFDTDPCTSEEDATADGLERRGLATRIAPLTPEYDSAVTITPLGRLILAVHRGEKVT